MLDQTEKRSASAKPAGPALDFQQHLKALEAAGLVTRIDRPIDKDTELHTLMRWQFVGGMPEEQRRAFLFTNVVDGSGKKYDMPVVVGALSANPEIYAIGMGKPVEEIGKAWIDAVDHPIKPVRIDTPAPCQEVVIKGDDLKKPDGGLKLLPVPISTPGFDAAPYFTATLCVTRDPESGIQNMGTYRGRPQSDRPARRAHGLADRRRRRLSALAEAPQAQDADADRDRQSAARRSWSSPARRSSPSTWTRWASPARSPASRSAR